ncbi:MAG: response regulator [Candidatus Rokubacteria bacterium]|nr:response regulator [Candidatus Rokubacteria bacterium]
MPRPILVVDDEADLVGTYERLLRRQGYRVISAGTRREALERVRSERLVLVVADLRLPDGDGLDIVRAARAVGSPPPVIVVTGFYSEASRRQALEAGAAAYLVKPFAISTFTALVEKVLGR